MTLSQQFKLLFAALFVLLMTFEVSAQTEDSAEAKSGVTAINSELVKTPHQIKRDSIRARKKVWTSIIGGPSYTPEASFGIGGAVLMSFKIDPTDSLSERSFLPMGFNISLNGTFVLAGSGTLYFKENKFRIYSKYAFRTEPAHFYGVGMDAGANTVRGEETTAYDEKSFNFYNRFVWQVKPALYVGPLMDLIWTSSSNLSDGVANNAYILENNPMLRYTNIGLGGMVQYDTRDAIATPTSGMLLSAIAKVYDRNLGSTYSYQNLDLEYRQYAQLFNRRSVLAWVARAQLGFGDIPFTDLPSFGSPFDLRGFYLNQYADKSAGYSIVEYRHMFGSNDVYKQGKFYSKLGFVTWVGAGSVGANPSEWDEWKYNYGVGLRIELQPLKNFRLDVGKGQGGKGWLFYMNMTEAF